MRSGFRLFAVWLVLHGSAGAQSPVVPSPLTLTDAWAVAERHNPGLAEARASLRTAESSIAVAAVRPNPVLRVESEGYPLFDPGGQRFIDNQELGIRAEIDIETAGRRGLRTRVAAVGGEAARAAHADARRRLRADVARAYLTVVLALADDGVARAVLGDVDRMMTVSNARFEQGELPGIELRRLRVERQRFADDVLSCELVLRNARAFLLSAMGASQLDQTFDLAQSLDGPVLSSEAPASPLPTGSIRLRFDVQAARLRVDQARTSLNLERANAVPGVTLGGGWRRSFGSNGIIFEVGVPLPLFNRNGAAIARAGADVAQAGARASSVEAAAALEAQLARNALDIARQRVVSVERDYVTSATESRDIVLASYRSGAASLIDYLDAERGWREAMRTRNRARFDYLMALQQLEATNGPESGHEATR